MRQNQGTRASGRCQMLVYAARAEPFVGLLTNLSQLAGVMERQETVYAEAVVQEAPLVASSLGTSWQAALASEVEGASSHLAFRSLRALVVLSTSRSY